MEQGNFGDYAPIRIDEMPKVEVHIVQSAENPTGIGQAPIPEAEKVLPANLCPLIKSSYGYAVTDTCPFFSASDLLMGETTSRRVVWTPGSSAL